MNLENKKILVTGGAGFVGSNLCKALVLYKNTKVYSLDNYFTGKIENHIDGVHYVKGETLLIHDLINFKPDIIFHLGEYSRVEQSFEDIKMVWKFNTQGTFAVLEFVRKTGAKLIYAGSSTKFGDNGTGSNASPYAWTKSSNTQLVKNYGTWFNIDYAITYFYNVYGKNEISEGKYATLIALFTRKYKNNDPLTVVSPGTQERNFTYIDDIISGLILVGENGKGDGYGIGSKDTFTILEIAKMFKGNIEMLPERNGNRMTAKLVTKKTEALGWKPKHSIKEYVTQLIS
jgi:UDP-glucose 4-epimerase